MTHRPVRHRTEAPFCARNRLPGVVRSVEIDGVMAIVEIQAGPFLVSAAVTREALDELGLAPGVEAAAVLKATDVMIDRGNG
ncbi:MAG: TOBE domain-containing protein [Solirubrobacteraceae bacterium]